VARRSTATLGNIRLVDFPLNVLLTRRGERSQLWFARDAVRYVSPTDRVSAEPTERGLLVRGITELDLELVCEALRQRFDNLQIGPPHVEFIEGPPRLEPYYSVVVTVPEDVMGYVMGDLSGRRGLIIEMEDTPAGKRIKADVPVIECFGYSAHLRSLTRGRGNYEFTFVGYRPYHGRSGPGPDVA